MFVFGEVQDPLPGTVKLVEAVVRGQIIEIVRTIFDILLPVVLSLAPITALHANPHSSGHSSPSFDPPPIIPLPLPRRSNLPHP